MPPEPRDSELLGRQLLGPLGFAALNSARWRRVARFHQLNHSFPSQHVGPRLRCRRFVFQPLEKGDELVGVDSEMVVDHSAIGIDQDEPGVPPLR